MEQSRERCPCCVRRGWPSADPGRRLQEAVGKLLLGLVADRGVDRAARPERVEDEGAHPLHHVEALGQEIRAGLAAAVELAGGGVAQLLDEERAPRAGSA